MMTQAELLALPSTTVVKETAKIATVNVDAALLLVMTRWCGAAPRHIHVMSSS